MNGVLESSDNHDMKEDKNESRLIFNEYALGKPSIKKNGKFSDIVQKGGRGSGSNHYFRTFRNNDIL